MSEIWREWAAACARFPGGYRGPQRIHVLHGSRTPFITLRVGGKKRLLNLNGSRSLIRSFAEAQCVRRRSSAREEGHHLFRWFLLSWFEPFCFNDDGGSTAVDGLWLATSRQCARDKGLTEQRRNLVILPQRESQTSHRAFAPERCLPPHSPQLCDRGC
jgi:hypothetical protein